MLKQATRIKQYLQSRTPFVCATLINVRGSSPGELGCKFVYKKGGDITGTIGGGKVEAKVIAQCELLLKEKGLPRVSIEKWNLQKDIGMTCGGEVSILFETYHAHSLRLAVFGAGHVAQALVRTLLPLDLNITCIDSRPEWIERLPTGENLTTKIAAEPADLVSDFGPDTVFLLMTKGHATDLPILYQVLNQFPDAAFIGVIGSPAKAQVLRQELVEKGLSSELAGRFKSPIGLDIGDNTPPEIAISIAAEILKIKDQML